MPRFNLTTVHVTNWQRWNRTKATFAAACWLTAVGAIGGTETNPDVTTPLVAYPGVAAISTTLLLATIWSLAVTRTR
jgi:hypothetical protein